jgi:archaemetzincin
MPDLNIQLLEAIDDDITNNLVKSLDKITGYATTINNGFTDLISFLDKERHQYNAVQIIESINFQNYDKSILITDMDLYIPIFTFVFGLAKLSGDVGIVSTHRLNSIYYGLPEDKDILKSRLKKEIIHELGHLQGLKHCERYDCVMTSSTVVEELDTKGESYCNSCIVQIKNNNNE